MFFLESPHKKTRISEKTNMVIYPKTRYEHTCVFYYFLIFLCGRVWCSYKFYKPF
jgi:hypothetical protein